MAENKNSVDDKPVFQNEFLTISICQDAKCLFADWSDTLDAGRARVGCLAVLECLKAHPHSKILNNNTNVTGHYPGAIDWVGTFWFPSMHALGVRWFAWVYSPDFYTQIGTDQIIKLSSQVSIETFYSVDDALHWLARFSEKAL